MITDLNEYIHILGYTALNILTLGSILDGVVIHSFTASSLIALLLIVVFLYLSSFFSGSEVAFFSLSPSNIEELRNGDERAKKVLTLLHDHDYLLGTLLISNNFVNIAVIMLTDYLVQSIFDFSNAPVVGFLIQVIGTTFIILLIGEIIPKVVTQQDPLRVCRERAGVLYSIGQFLSPVNGGLVKLGAWVSKPLQRDEDEIDHEELSKAIELTTNDEEEQGVLNEIILFHRRIVSEVMTPRVDMTTLDIEEKYPNVKRFVIDNGYSRIPVYEDRIDNVKGILYAKDLLPYLNESDDFDWTKLLREAMYVPESVKVSHLLEDFQKQHKHLAIVVDEFGGTSGLVTMEDLLEEIVGEINDEYDDDQPPLFRKHADGSYIFDGKISILDFLREVRVENYEDILHETDEAETLGGLLLEVKGDFPSIGEEIIVEGHSFRILEMGRRRISKVLFRPRVVPPMDANQDD